jgi:oligopeptide transport system ATP-binding protein
MNVANENKNYILIVENLEKRFPIKRGVLKRTIGYVHAINDVSFAIEQGESVGLVGESGCGKTTLGKCILSLFKPTSGRVIFNGFEMNRLSASDLRKVRPRLQMIFQDPFSTLNPRISVKAMLDEPLRIIVGLNETKRKIRISELLDQVGLRPEFGVRYPHEFSGGQRQRLAIARALALNPSLIICDEPVSALDVSIQAQILNLLDDLRKKLQLSYLFISHDIGVVEHIADRIAVMYLGKIVEIAKDIDICQNPLHPYTKALMAAVPLPQPKAKDRQKNVLSGDVPSPIELPKGCFFHPRCPHAMPVCRENEPSMIALYDGRSISCHLFQQSSI